MEWNIARVSNEIQSPGVLFSRLPQNIKRTKRQPPAYLVDLLLRIHGKDTEKTSEKG